MLQLKSITKDYTAGTQIVHALKGITLDFRKNEFVSVLGPSGCGKTTLMNIIGGLDKYTSGNLIINAKSTKEYKDNDWDNYRNKRIGFIFQSYNLIPHLTVFGNVEIALTISGISSEERNRRTKKALEEVGLSKQINQKPNQLSGGQMQRVAIARALVNNPEILLADEPTGALDTETSEQIMTLIKNIAKDRLVIMVTHNPELAEKHSTRIIKMLDGKLIDDSRPYNADKDLALLQESEKNKEPHKKKKAKSAMSYKTALSLSGRNLIKKKGRTLLTSIAGSIGIIGIALILALSNGMNNYITNLQRDTLSSNPITITSTSINMSQAMNAMRNREVFDKFPNAKEIYVEKAVSLMDIMTKNNITEGYIKYLNEEIDAAWYNDIMLKTGLSLNIYGKKAGQTVYNPLETESASSGMFGSSSAAWQVLLKHDFIDKQYELLEGSYPVNKNQMVIIVSETNQISEETLIALGLRTAGDEETKYSFSDAMNMTYKVVPNNHLFTRVGNQFMPIYENINFEASQTLEVVGIMRIKESVDGGVLSPGIGYTKELYDWLQNENRNSEIINFMQENPALDPINGGNYVPKQDQTGLITAAMQRENDYRSLGGETLANEISIYPVSFEAKELIKDSLNNYNSGREKDDMVTYIDMSEILGNTLSSMVNVISYVLIGFTAISLLVSSIMIAIITYVSVLERTKEIGILRSIGARKKDVTRVFNAETIIIGFVAGLLGVLVAYLLTIPINFVIKALVDINKIASLSILYALILIIISILLTLISGLIPARKAAKQDPVTALRTE